MTTSRRWTIYLCQDKHLDYNWCGTTTEIELRMAAVLDYYLEQAERYGGRWNIDSTLWLAVYRRHRGEAGASRLLSAIRDGSIGYGVNHSVQLWGLMSTETAIRSCLPALEIERTSGRPADTALIMENWGLQWGIATILTECGITRLARGTYTLRAEEYYADRAPYPLFYWQAPNGKRLLVYWPPYVDTKSYGGYAEAHALETLAGQKWDAFHVQTASDRNTPEVFAKRCEYIRRTVERYESLGEDYPVSSIMLLGTGWDNWTLTDDYRRFIERYHEESDGTVRIVDARYDEYFAAVETELAELDLSLPTLAGSFGITWDEWAAHLAGTTADYREAERRLRIGEARRVLEAVAECGAGDHQRQPGKAAGTGGASSAASEGARRARLIAATRESTPLRAAYDGLMRFLEHDMGGCNRTLAAVSAGVREAAVTEALDLAHVLDPAGRTDDGADTGRTGSMLPPLRGKPEVNSFEWRGWSVTVASDRFGLSSLVDPCGLEHVRSNDRRAAPLFGEPVFTRFDDAAQHKAVFPEVVDSPRPGGPEFVLCRRDEAGVTVHIEGRSRGFGVTVRLRFDETKPWIDAYYRFTGGWDEHARTVQICFPAALDDPVYRFDVAGAVLRAGSQARGGDDLPGANPELFAAQTFAVATERAAGSAGAGVRGTENSGTEHDGTMTVVSPDAYLFQFGPGAVRDPAYEAAAGGSLITSLPMMNLTRQDRQLGQGGRDEWTFRYRIVFGRGAWNPIETLREVQQFATPPFLKVPGLPAAVPAVDTLDIDFPGGPLQAIKVAEENDFFKGHERPRVILRFWNVRDTATSGSLSLPPGFEHAQICDAFERPVADAECSGDRVSFTAEPGCIVTLALVATEAAPSTT